MISFLLPSGGQAAFNTAARAAVTDAIGSILRMIERQGYQDLINYSQR